MDGSIATVLSAARSQLGVPYHWAWEKPGIGFDCSGLTQWAYAQAGIKLPRTTITQVTRGTKVARANLQPGDLVFPEFPVHHVQIYSGNGMVIESPETGKNVREVPMWGFYTARRVVANVQSFGLPDVPVGPGDLGQDVGVAVAGSGGFTNFLGIPSFSDLMKNARGFMIRIVEGLIGVALIIVAVGTIGGEKVMKNSAFKSAAKVVM